MKKILLLIAPFLMLSCSNDDAKVAETNSGNLKTESFNPPSWIQGVWAKDNAGAQDFYFSITGDDINLASPASNGITWKQAVDGYNANNTEYVITEEVTNTTYTVGYATGYSEQLISFEKLANNKINVTVVKGAAPQGATGELTKQ